MFTLLLQLVMVLLSATKLAMPAGRMPLVVMLPSTLRSWIVAPQSSAKGAAGVCTSSLSTLMLTESVWSCPSNVPLKGRSIAPATLVTLMLPVSFTVCPL